MSDNGHLTPEDTILEEALKRTNVEYGDLSGEDGLLTRTGPVNSSLLQKLSNFNKDDLLSEIKMSNFQSPNEGDRLAACLNETEFLQLPVIDVLRFQAARSAGKGMQYANKLLDTVGRSSYSFAYPKGNKYASRKSKDSPFTS